MKKIIIIGSGGLAIETYSFLKKCFGQKIKKKILGFISSDKPKVIIDGKKILGNDEFLLKNFSNINLIIAIGNIKTRKKIFDSLKNKKYFWPNIHLQKFNFKSENIKIGKGNIFFENSLICPNVTIGDFNVINMNSVVSHDCKINNFCNLNPSSVISGGVKIEDFCQIGSNSTIYQNLRLKKNSTVAIGGALFNDTEIGSTYLGNPAKRISFKK